MTKLPKHIVLSRKGFDSSAGGVANWIYEGKLYPIPIPQAYSGIAYREMQFNESLSYYDVMKDLGITQFSEGHLDPDINPFQIKNRHKDWKPVFGQHAAALSHLQQREVGLDDLFLFFGWFKEIERVNGRFRYQKNSPDLHVIWGYLEVDELVDLSKEKPNSWVKYHPHCVFAKDYIKGNLNTLFIAKDKGNVFAESAGSGIFNYHENVVLTETKNNQNRGFWKLPNCFFNAQGKCLLSYHEKRIGQPKGRGWYQLASANRGQEFVLDTALLTNTQKNRLFTWLNNLKT